MSPEQLQLPLARKPPENWTEWAMCVRCGDRPSQLDPLPPGWEADREMPHALWFWCPHHPQPDPAHHPGRIAA